jgi:hypothetical protein
VPEIEQTSNVKAVDDRIPPITAVTATGTAAEVPRPLAIGIGRPPRGATNTWQMTDLFGEDLDSCGCCCAMFLQALTGGAMSTACALRLAHMPCTPRSSSHFAESAGFIRSNSAEEKVMPATAFRARTQAGLMPTRAALPVAQFPPFEFVSGGVTATRAYEPARPSRLDERGLALLLGAVVPQESRHRQSLLKLNSILKGLTQQEWQSSEERT